MATHSMVWYINNIKDRAVSAAFNRSRLSKPGATWRREVGGKDDGG